MSEEQKAIATRVRRNILKMIHHANSGHPGGSLGAADIMVALYFNVMHIDKDNVHDLHRDKFVLSKGHCCPALYAVLKEKGILSQEDLMTFRIIDSRLQGHPNMNDTPGVDMSTGSLGQGLAAGVGMALANKLDGNRYRTYVLCGDGECDEGEIWEAAMAAAHYRLDNLLLIVDRNRLQIDGWTAEVMNTAVLEDKFAAFGWHVATVDGHDIDAVTAAAKAAEAVKGQPSVLIADTIKGKGVSFMENQAGWHGKAPNDEQLAQALAELGGND
jgi:transketolase